MDEVDTTSPFAAFAVPKRNAVEEYQEQRRQAAVARRKMIGCILAALVGSIGGATACAAFNADFAAVFTSLVAAFIGGVAGAVLGAFVGAVAFAALSVANVRARSIGNEFVRRDPLSAMRGLMFAWSLIGTAIGASVGAQAGATWAGVILIQQPLGRWTMIGSLIGGGFALVVWFIVSRRPAQAEESLPG